jgi:purine-binding chemotaxis protein CheW
MDRDEQTLPNDPNGRPPTATASNGRGHRAGNGQPATGKLGDEKLVEIWTRRAAELATPPPVKPEGATLDLLVFRLSGERYGLKVNYVREIYPAEQITPVPRTPEFVVGVFSARGRLLSIVDLRAFFGLPHTGLSDASKIIVVTSGNGAHDSNGHFEVGLLADEVEDVLTIFEDDLGPALSTQIGNQAEYTIGITSDMLVVLSLNALLQNKRLIVHEEV